MRKPGYLRRFTNNFKWHLRSVSGFLFFFLFRRMERLFPIKGIYQIFYPPFFIRAAFNTIFAKPSPEGPLPPFFRTPEPLISRIRERTNDYMNRALLHVPDRLIQPRWRERCEIEGLHHLDEARKNGQPVFLVFCHFGPYHLLHLWLRALGRPAATFSAGISANRSRLRRHQDTLWTRPDLPVALFKDQLRQIPAYLSAGNLLLMAIDVPSGKQTTAPFCPGWNFQMATGPLRLAARYRARMLTCSITTVGPWRFRITVGHPMGDHSLPEETNWQKMGELLVGEMRPDFQTHPEQCSFVLLRCLKRNDKL